MIFVHSKMGLPERKRKFEKFCFLCIGSNPIVIVCYVKLYFVCIEMKYLNLTAWSNRSFICFRNRYFCQSHGNMYKQASI